MKLYFISDPSQLLYNIITPHGVSIKSLLHIDSGHYGGQNPLGDNAHMFMKFVRVKTQKTLNAMMKKRIKKVVTIRHNI